MKNHQGRKYYQSQKADDYLLSRLSGEGVQKLHPATTPAQGYDPTPIKGERVNPNLIRRRKAA